MNINVINSSTLAIWDRICGRLPSHVLKRVRLVCKALNYSAEQALFRLVWLRPNIDSFHRLDLISRHPVLRSHVTTIHHSGEVIYDYPDFDKWNERLGGEMDLSWDSRDSLREQFTMEDLKYHYLKYRHHMEGQTYLSTGRNAELWLAKAFEKMKRIDTIEYATRDVGRQVRTGEPIPWSSLSAIGRETLSEPCHMGATEDDQARQFIALLQAAFRSCKNLTTIKGFHLDWEIFEEPDRGEIMLDAVRHVQHLILTVSNYPIYDLEGHRKMLARVIANAPDLKTLELFFGCLPTESSEHVLELNQLLTNRVHWPILQRLVLQGFRTTEKVFKKFLNEHAANLKSLGLSNMEFALVARGDGIACGGSFLSLIHFLRFSLKLENVKFDGTLSNHWDEGWIVDWRNRYTHDKSCLKYWIERYIVHGGHCPLQPPDKKNEADGWKERGDRSWRFEYKLIQ